MSKEIWRQIPGYPGYAVSSRGHVMNTRLNKTIEGRPYGKQTRVSIKSKDGFWHEYPTDRLMSMVDFGDQESSVGIRKIRIVETGKVFNNVSEVATALVTDDSSVYKALRGDRPRVMGVTVEYFYD